MTDFADHYNDPSAGDPPPSIGIDLNPSFNPADPIDSQANMVQPLVQVNALGQRQNLPDAPPDQEVGDPDDLWCSTSSYSGSSQEDGLAADKAFCADLEVNVLPEKLSTVIDNLDQIDVHRISSAGDSLTNDGADIDSTVNISITSDITRTGDASEISTNAFQDDSEGQSVSDYTAGSATDDQLTSTSWQADEGEFSGTALNNPLDPRVTLSALCRSAAQNRPLLQLIEQIRNLKEIADDPVTASDIAADIVKKLDLEIPEELSKALGGASTLVDILNLLDPEEDSVDRVITGSLLSIKAVERLGLVEKLAPKLLPAFRFVSSVAVVVEAGWFFVEGYGQQLLDARILSEEGMDSYAYSIGFVSGLFLIEPYEFSTLKQDSNSIDPIFGYAAGERHGVRSERWNYFLEMGRRDSAASPEMQNLIRNLLIDSISAEGRRLRYDSLFTPPAIRELGLYFHEYCVKPSGAFRD